jgi:hypothetical protein
MFKRHARGLLIGLAIQYVFGMVVNLYYEFPDTTDAHALEQAAWSHWPLAVHMILAILLVISAIVFVVQAVRAKDKRWIMISSLGLIALALAGHFGDQFVRTQQEGYSFAMAMAFIVAAVAYGWGAFTEPAPASK